MISDSVRACLPGPDGPDKLERSDLDPFMSPDSQVYTPSALACMSSISALKCFTRNGQELIRNTRSIITTMKLYL